MRERCIEFQRLKNHNFSFLQQQKNSMNVVLGILGHYLTYFGKRLGLFYLRRIPWPRRGTPASWWRRPRPEAAPGPAAGRCTSWCTKNTCGLKGSEKTQLKFHLVKKCNLDVNICVFVCDWVVYLIHLADVQSEWQRVRFRNGTNRFHFHFRSLLILCHFRHWKFHSLKNVKYLFMLLCVLFNEHCVYVWVKNDWPSVRKSALRLFLSVMAMMGKLVLSVKTGKRLRK